MSVTHISTCAELDALLKKNKRVVVDFYATWCGPCNVIAPEFEALARKHDSIAFVKVDVDNATEVARRYSVSAMPTFMFFRNGTQESVLRGADKNGLVAKVRNLASKDNSVAFSGTGQTLGGSKIAADSPATASTDGAHSTDLRAKVLLGLVVAFISLWYLC